MARIKFLHDEKADKVQFRVGDTVQNLTSRRVGTITQVKTSGNRLLYLVRYKSQLHGKDLIPEMQEYVRRDEIDWHSGMVA